MITIRSASNKNLIECLTAINMIFNLLLKILITVSSLNNLAVEKSTTIILG